MQNDNHFNYTYTAPTEQERAEIESIRRQYVTGTDSEPAADRLRRLHSRVVNSSTVAGLIFGVVGILVFGTGLTCVLEWNEMLLGVLASIAGAVLMALAYPIYKFTLKRLKAKYSDEIIRLSDELLGKDK